MESMDCDSLLSSSSSTINVELVNEISLLKFLTYVYKRDYFNIDELCGLIDEKYVQSHPIDDYSVVISKDEAEQILLSSNNFMAALNLSITRITETFMNFLELTNECVEIGINKKIFKNALSLAKILQQFFKVSEQNIRFYAVESEVSKFLVSLIKLLNDTDVTDLQNMCKFRIITEVLMIWKEVEFARNVIFIELCKHLEEMNQSISKYDQSMLYDTGFYEKLAHILKVLKDLLVYCVEWGTIYETKAYELDEKSLATLISMLEEVCQSLPTYLTRVAQDCINLLY